MFQKKLRYRYEVAAEKKKSHRNWGDFPMRTRKKEFDRLESNRCLTTHELIVHNNPNHKPDMTPTNVATLE